MEFWRKLWRELWRKGSLSKVSKVSILALFWKVFWETILLYRKTFQKRARIDTFDTFHHLYIIYIINSILKSFYFSHIYFGGNFGATRSKSPKKNYCAKIKNMYFFIYFLLVMLLQSIHKVHTSKIISILFFFQNKNFLTSLFFEKK
jgi:hypothetical protein